MWLPLAQHDSLPLSMSLIFHLPFGFQYFLPHSCSAQPRLGWKQKLNVCVTWVTWRLFLRAARAENEGMLEVNCRLEAQKPKCCVKGNVSLTVCSHCKCRKIKSGKVFLRGKYNISDYHLSRWHVVSTRCVSAPWKGGYNFKLITSLQQHIDFVLTRYRWHESRASDRRDLNDTDMRQDFNHGSTCVKLLNSWHKILLKIILNASQVHNQHVTFIFCCWLPSFWSHTNIFSITLKTPHYRYSQLFMFQPTHKSSSVNNYPQNSKEKLKQAYLTSTCSIQNMILVIPSRMPMWTGLCEFETSSCLLMVVIKRQRSLSWVLWHHRGFVPHNCLTCVHIH